MFNIDKTTAQRINQLLKLQMIKLVGSGKSTKYVIDIKDYKA